MFRVFPAPAGINRLAVNSKNDLYSVPRASGDKPTVPEFDGANGGCSPRQRG